MEHVRCAVRGCNREVVDIVTLGPSDDFSEFTACAEHALELSAGETFTIDEDRSIRIGRDAAPSVLRLTLHRERSRHPSITLGLGHTADVEQEFTVQLPPQARKLLYQWLSTRIED